MIYWLTQLWQAQFGVLRVFQYLTFRSILAAITSLLIVLVMGPIVIRALRRLQVGQFVRDDGPQSHLSKQGTPTMGGVLILLAIALSAFCWGDLNSVPLFQVMFITLAYGAIGGLDDYRKVVLKTPKGLSARMKFFLQSLFAIAVIVWIEYYAIMPEQTLLFVPFVKHVAIDLGILFPVLCYFVIVGTSNAVNLTDGLDGLAIMPTVMITAALGIFAYVEGNTQYANYLMMPYLHGVGELAVFAAALVGAGLGFLWFNSYPAEVFMGDVGSLALGGALGTFAILVRQELVLFIMGGVFVVETLSVVLQVASFKMRGKRIFRMAPIHHHFELAGWPEPKVIVRFWIVTFILVLIGLATLKLR